jgi:hypothetical protein
MELGRFDPEEPALDAVLVGADGYPVIVAGGESISAYPSEPVAAGRSPLWMRQPERGRPASTPAQSVELQTAETRDGQLFIISLWTGAEGDASGVMTIRPDGEILGEWWCDGGDPLVVEVRPQRGRRGGKLWVGGRCGRIAPGRVVVRLSLPDLRETGWAPVGDTHPITGLHPKGQGVEVVLGRSKVNVDELRIP